MAEKRKPLTKGKAVDKRRGVIDERETGVRFPIIPAGAVDKKESEWGVLRHMVRFAD